MIIAILTLGLAMAGLAAVVYQLMRQQGRLLLRLDHLERLLEIESGQPVAEDPEGLPLGATLPGFELPDLEGRAVTLEALRGWRALLVNWSAACGFCRQIAAELAELEPDLERAGVRLLLVSGGSAASERELAEKSGLRSSVLLQEGEGLPVFHNLGTPAACLLDEEGRLAEPVVVGADKVPDLARRVAGAATPRRGRRPLSQSRIEREGLKPGTMAPDFELPEVRGGTVSLAQHRGRKVLLVFSDPHCGPCDELAPHLARLQEEHRHNRLDLLMVGRGDPEENRRKTEEQGLRFPVALQRKWEISRQYGIFGTPVGFLIDENGVITSNVAKGIEPIMALAGKAGPGKEVSDVQAV